MDDNLWIGFIMGCAVGFDMDSDDIDAVLQQVGLTSASSLEECHKAIRTHVGEARWKNGLSLFRLERAHQKRTN